METALGAKAATFTALARGVVALFFTTFVTTSSCASRNEEGRFCDENADCEEACLKFERPEGSGSCGPFRQENQTCSRPDFTDHDCKPNLRCTADGTCVRGAWCPPSRCGAGEVCLEPDGICVFFCSSDAECGNGCCQKLEGRGASICVSRALCTSGADAGGEDATADAKVSDAAPDADGD